MRAALVGRGRMGGAIAGMLGERGHVVVAQLGRGDGLDAVVGAEVAFEFTTPAAAEANVLRLLALGVPTVCGTTAWDATRARAAAAELGVPLVVEANFALGVAVLRRLVEEAAARLLAFGDYDVGIVERHHRKKLDAPSGTAKMLAAAVEAASGRSVAGIVALRVGEQPGEHQVMFEGPEESLELTHRARSRRLFAHGAVCAAERLLARPRTGGAVRLVDLLETTS